MAGILRGTIGINNGVPGVPDGEVSLSDNAWGFGANVGLLFEPLKSTRVGVTWLSAVRLDFRATPTWTGLGPGIERALSRTGMTAPNRVMVGVHQELSPQWSLMGDFGWESWSQFGRTEVSVDTANPVSLTKTVAYQDTWHLALGAQSHLSEPWTFSAGFAYDSSMMADSARTVLTPTGQQFRYALGAQWAVSKSVTLGVHDTFLWGGDLPVSQERGSLAGRVEGRYAGTVVNAFAMNVRWTF